ncbi:unnamed protein product [marine sediment metagenome]|uniref:Uncharacterized protein n=1 Tax=marine sediment metagenome TaxID=412755 RepID=X1D0A4_9ZZZZ
MSYDGPVISRIRQQMMIRNPDYRDEDFDICECGDYRHQHENGDGECKVCRWNNSIPSEKPCQKFVKAN